MRYRALFVCDRPYPVSPALFSCGTKSRPESTKKITVVTTLFPLYDFTRSIADNKADILLMLPPGVEAHAFEPKPADIIKVDKADLFIYTGKYMEPWAAGYLTIDFQQEAYSRRCQSRHQACPAWRRPPLIPRPTTGTTMESYDPHIWLDFDNAMKMVDTITEGLCKADPANCDILSEKCRYIQGKTCRPGQGIPGIPFGLQEKNIDPRRPFRLRLPCAQIRSRIYQCV